MNLLSTAKTTNEWKIALDMVKNRAKAYAEAKGKEDMIRALFTVDKFYSNQLKAGKTM